MRKILSFIVLLFIVGGIIAVGLRACQGLGQGEPPAQPVATTSPTYTPLPVDVEAEAVGADPEVFFFFEGPDTGLVGGPVVPLELSIASNVPVGSVALEIPIPVSNLLLQDTDAETPGLQAFPVNLPAETVQQNDVGVDNVLRFTVTGLGDGVIPTRTLLLLPLEPIATGIAEVRVQLATVTSPEGGMLNVRPDANFWMEITDAAAPSPTPDPTLSPTSTPPPPTDGACPPTLECPPPDACPTEPVCPQPSCAAPPSCPAVVSPIRNGIYYRIQRGENLFRLAHRFGSTVEEISAVNDICDVRSVPTGQLIYVPVCPPDGQTAYVVSSCDTIYSIAQLFGLTAEEVAAMNNMAPPYTIHRGNYIVVKQ